MKILIISGSFYPQNTPRAFRTTELAKELAEQGHEVRVYIPNIKYNYAELIKDHKTLDIRLCRNLAWRDVKLSGSRLKYWIHRIIRRILIQFLEYPSIQWYLKMPQILKNEKGYDLLISIAVPHPIHWGIARCMKKGMNPSKTWVADCGDPYMGLKTGSFKRPFYFSYLEKLFCKKADFITIPVESGRSSYYKQFHHKIIVIPQGFNFEEVKKIKYQAQQKIRFCYAGGFIPNRRDPRPILDALERIDVEFEFIVYTKQKNLFAGYDQKLQNKLIINDYVDRIELIKIMSGMDFLLNIENGTTAQIPSKLIDYALSDRPILSLDSQSLDVQKLSAFLHRDYSSQLIVDNLEDYNIKNVAKKFIDLTTKKHA